MVIVVVMKISNTWIKALLLDAHGRRDEVDCFSYTESAEVDASCGLTFRNNFYIYGGRDKKRQISQIIGQELTVIGNLTSDFYFGACTTMADQIFLCFAVEEPRKCIMASDALITDFTEMVSNHPHSRTRVSSSDCEFSLACY